MLNPSSPIVSAEAYPERPSKIQLASAFLYSCSGGFADATGFLIAGSYAGHITGNLVLLSTKGASGQWLAMSRPLTAIVLFILATECGILSAKYWMAGLKWIVFAIQCSIICSLGIGTVRHAPWFDLAVVIALSLCLGIQNGVVSSIDGVVVHSSYMTGTITRLLKSLSAPRSFETLRQAPATLPSVDISGTVIFGFMMGAICAVIAHHAVGSYSPLFLCLPLFAATVSRSQRWQINPQPKHAS